MTDRVQRTDRALPDRDVDVADKTQQRFEGAAVAQMGERRGDGDQQIAVVFLQQPNQRFDRPRVADPAQRHDRGPPGLGVVADELFDQPIDHRRPEPHDRLEQLLLHAGCAEQQRQRALHFRAAQPAEHDHELPQGRSGGPAGRVDQALHARG